MHFFIAELIGSALLILLGNGVVANTILNKTKGHGGGWIVITFGWAMAVFVGVVSAAAYSGAHLNPAVTIALAVAGKFAWNLVPSYILAQFLGSAFGAFLVWLSYRDHFNATEDADTKLACFSTIPAIRKPMQNLLTEIIGTFTLVSGVLYMSVPQVGLGALDALPVAFLVLGIGLSLGGATGYAINPTRDLAPRVMHALLPMANKGGSDWGYAWVPIVGPLIGAIFAAMTSVLLLG
jgi:glycerol uptake facilitator protein